MGVGSHARDGSGEQVAAVPGDLFSAGGQQLGRREPVRAQEALDVGGRGVARLPGVDHHDPAPGAGQDQRGGEPRGASADDHHVVLVHAQERRGFRGSEQRLLLFPGRARSNGRRDDSGEPPPTRRERHAPEGATAIAAALDLVGPRLRRVRTQRGLTLTVAAAHAGISKSTLSRLENGQRRPSLELLLPLAQVYRVPIDDLVGAPEVGDPRIRLKPRRVNGRTVLPLTRPGGVQAWKIVIPVSQATPKPRTHDGFEWLYVLAGRMRLILGDRDVVLGVGEAAEFDTQVPHWFGSTGRGPGGGAEHLRAPGRAHARPGSPRRPEHAPRPTPRPPRGLTPRLGRATARAPVWGGRAAARDR